jgi:hypothetical protein
MKWTILFIAAMVCNTQTHAQKKTTFYFMPQVGLLNGDQYVSAQASLTGGMEIKEWGIGLGAAIDYYKVRSVPVFADIRKNITAGTTTPVFVYASFGMNIAAALESQRRRVSGWGDLRSNYEHGLYTEGGFGCLLWNTHNTGLVLSLGYTSKTITEKYTENIYPDFPPYIPVSTERKLNYTFNRVVLKIGVRIGKK